MNDTRLLPILIAAATKAPSIHNTQPWHFVAHGTVIDVRADRSRALPVIDPTGRQLIISCGAVIEHLCIAARALGSEPAVRLLPDPTDPDLLALVDLSGRHVSSPDDRTLARALFQRRTVRAPFEPRRVDERLTGRLADEAACLGAWADVLADTDDLLATAVLESHADESERSDEAYLAELASWRRENGVDGIPSAALAPTEGRRTRFPLRDFRAGDDDAGQVPLASAAPKESDQLLVIGTDGDQQLDWLVAGRALARLWVRATVLGLVASPLTQALDSDVHRGWLRRALRYQSYPQMVLRVGYGSPAVTVPTPRRPLHDLLTVAGR
jgi:hypothetical protein